MKNMNNELENLFDFKDETLRLKPEFTLKSKEYLNWVKYIPKSWESFLEKDYNELSSKEKALYEFNKIEKELIPLFESFIKSKNIYHSKLIYSFMELLPIYEYANIKLNDDEKQECYDRLHNMIYTDNNKMDPIRKLYYIKTMLNPNKSVKDSYICYLIDTRINNIKQTNHNEMILKKKIRK